MTTSSAPSTSTPGAMHDTGRALTYGLAFIGLMGSLFAIVGLIGLLLAQTVFSSRNIVSVSDARQQGSYLLAALIVSLPIWLGFWRVIAVRVNRHPGEHAATDRRLFFAGILAVTSIAALFSLHTILRVLFSVAGPHDLNASLQDGVPALLRLLAYGAAGAYYTRLGWRERSIAQRDAQRDLALAMVTGCSLAFLAIGVAGAAALLVGELQNLGGGSLFDSGSTTITMSWGETLAWIVSGGSVWGTALYLGRRGTGIRDFRVVYLYIVLAAGALITVGWGSNLVYETVRRLFGYEFVYGWDFLRTDVPLVVSGGMVWLVHGRFMHEIAVTEGPDATPHSVLWPRRPYLAAVAFAGIGVTAVGGTRLLWVVADFLFGRNSLVGSDWWRDGASLGIALAVVGLALWLSSWPTLQAAAQAVPAERSTDSRRRLLAGVTGLALLALVGFTIAFLWLVLQMVLGGPHDAGTTSDMARYFATALVAAAVAGYYGSILRADGRAGTGRKNQVRIAALVEAGSRETVDRLARLGYRIDVVGYLPGTSAANPLHLPQIEEQLATVAASGASRALLVLTGAGAMVYPYSKNPVPGLDESTSNPVLQVPTPAQQ